MLVTAPLHPEADALRDYEVELVGRPIPTTGWIPGLQAYRDAKRFSPDIVVTEFLRDPRWRIFATLAPRVRLLHDAAPHDDKQVAPWWNRMFFERWDTRADATVVFSKYVAERAREVGLDERSLYVAPLTSDLDPARTPGFVSPEDRRNFFLIGRQYPYKNHRVVFSAWESHTQGASWQGDELILLGDGEVPHPLPRHATWRRGQYRYREMASELATAKASLVHTRAASQSGVQVLSMSLGVPTLVSTAGGLPEYQPPGMSVTGIDDVQGLARAMDELADPVRLRTQAASAAEHYKANYDVDVAALRLLEIFEEVARL
jgi:glycosyltransferase involved in cell wall biosynthesis